MILVGHSDASYINKSKARSLSEAHIILSEDKPVPKINGSVLTIAQMIKFVMSSAAEADMTGLNIAAKEMVPLRHTLIEMG